MNPLRTDVLSSENRNENNFSTKKQRLYKKKYQTAPESEAWILAAHHLE